MKQEVKRQENIEQISEGIQRAKNARKIYGLLVHII